MLADLVGIHSAVGDVAPDVMPEILAYRCESEVTPVDGDRSTGRVGTIGLKEVAPLGIVMCHRDRERLDDVQDVPGLVNQSSEALGGASGKRLGQEGMIPTLRMPSGMVRAPPTRGAHPTAQPVAGSPGVPVQFGSMVDTLGAEDT
jgi:hypothetical protein